MIVSFKEFLEEKENKYMITAKKGDKVIKQVNINYNDLLNLVRKILINVQSMEESSADLQAMKIVDSVKKGKAKSMENSKSGYTMVIQLA